MLGEFSWGGAAAPACGGSLVRTVGLGGDLRLEDRALPSTVLTGRTWTLTSTDEAGTSWSNSKLVFTVQGQDTAAGAQVEGYFDWVRNGRDDGRELFRGSISATGALEIQGYDLENPDTIVLAAYHAQIGPDGNSIINGTWDGSGVIPGTWSATAPVPGASGDGLRATYYDNPGFTGRSAARVDRTVNFVWGTGRPLAAIGGDTFSVRWTGQVQAVEGGTYTFRTVSDEAVRVFVNGRLVINNWTRHRQTIDTGTISLAAGQRYNIRVDYFDWTGTATVRLQWKRPGQSNFVVVPQAQLFSSAAASLSLPPDVPVLSGVFVGGPAKRLG